MTPNGSLRPRQTKLIAALLQSKSIADAAAACHIGERTAYKWLRLPEFVSALRAAETDAIGQAVTALVADMHANLSTLRGLRDTPPIDKPELSLRAAIALDNSLLRWRELLDVETRLARLEEALLHGTKY